jgi:hypothetical protein
MKESLDTEGTEYIQNTRTMGQDFSSGALFRVYWK